VTANKCLRCMSLDWYGVDDGLPCPMCGEYPVWDTLTDSPLRNPPTRLASLRLTHRPPGTITPTTPHYSSQYASTMPSRVLAECRNELTRLDRVESWLILLQSGHVDWPDCQHAINSIRYWRELVQKRIVSLTV
jgi:hypothetical protein